MLYSPAFSFSSGYPLGVLPCAGLRLGVLRQFQAFLASSACAACASSYHFSSIASPPWRSAFSRFAPVVNLGFPVLASGSNCAVKPTRLRRAAYFRSLVPSYFALCRPAFIPALRISQRLSKPFWPPALASQAPPAIILAVLHRFRGPALFRGLRPSSRQGVPFWPSGLTLRSSGPAFCGPLTLAVSPHKTRFIQFHAYQNGIALLKRCSARGLPFLWVSPGGTALVCGLFGLQRLRSKRYQLSFCKHCAASVAPCFFAVRAHRQMGASRFGVWV